MKILKNKEKNESMKLKSRRNTKGKKNIIMLSLVVLMFFIGIGFSYIQSSLSITGSSTIPSGMWDVYFANLAVTSGSMTPEPAATLSSDKKSINFALNFKDKNDYYEFTVDVVNNGTLDAMVSDFAVSGITSAYQDYLKYTVTYSSGGAAVKNNDKLLSKKSTKIKIRIYFNTSADVTKVPIDSGVNLSISLPYVQATS